MKLSPIRRLAGVLLLGAAVFVPQALASSHREALAVLNEPCADNTDTYAWVSDGAHDKLYLIMDFNPLHEPGQGNQGFRACNGYRYEFHIGKGISLKDEAVYRIEFVNKLAPEGAPSASDGLGQVQDPRDPGHGPGQLVGPAGQVGQGARLPQLRFQPGFE